MFFYKCIYGVFFFFFSRKFRWLYNVLFIHADKESDGYDDEHTHEYIFEQLSQLDGKTQWG